MAKKDMKSILIVGNGGMARALLDLIQFSGNLNVAGFYWESGEELCGLPIFNRIDDVDPDTGLVLGMLIPTHRKQHVEQLGKDRFVSVLDGFISQTATIEDGAVVVHDSYVMSLAHVGAFAHIHTHAIIGHDCVIGEYTFVGPASILGGRSNVGSSCRIGMGSLVLPDVVIGDNVTVAAGTVVTKNVEQGITVSGNPARSAFRTVPGRF